MLQPAVLAAILLSQAAPGAVVAAAPSPPADVDLRNAPHWLLLPTVAEVARAYPDAARRRSLAGQAVLACTLDADGWLRACRVAVETPQGYGFGQAAMSLAGRFKMSPLTAAGESVEGRPIEAPIFFGPKRRR
jgi:TonB family protein